MDGHAATLAFERVAAELDLPQSVRRADAGREGLLAHLASQDRARLVPSWGGDVDPLEVVAVAGEGLDLALGRGAGDRKGSEELGGRSGNPTTSPIFRNRSRSPGVKSSIETR